MSVIKTFCKEGETRKVANGKDQPLMLWVILKRTEKSEAIKPGFVNVVIRCEQNPLPFCNIYCSLIQYNWLCSWLQKNGWNSVGECYDNCGVR